MKLHQSQGIYPQTGSAQQTRSSSTVSPEKQADFGGIDMTDSVAEPRDSGENPFGFGMTMAALAIPVASGVAIGFKTANSFGPAAGLAVGLTAAVLAAPVGAFTGLLYGAVSGSLQ